MSFRCTCPLSQFGEPAVRKQCLISAAANDFRQITHEHTLAHACTSSPSSSIRVITTTTNTQHVLYCPPKTKNGLRGPNRAKCETVKQWLHVAITCYNKLQCTWIKLGVVLDQMILGFTGLPSIKLIVCYGKLTTFG